MKEIHWRFTPGLLLPRYYCQLELSKGLKSLTHQDQRQVMTSAPMATTLTMQKRKPQFNPLAMHPPHVLGAPPEDFLPTEPKPLPPLPPSHPPPPSKGLVNTRLAGLKQRLRHLRLTET